MPRIRMLRTTPGSPDGYNTVMYTKDTEYHVPSEIPAQLAKTFVEDMKRPPAIYVTADTPPIETKAIPAAPENAAIETAPKNKVEEVKETETVEEAPKETEPKDVPEDKEPETAKVTAKEVAKEPETPKEDDVGWEPPKKEVKTVRVHELADELGISSKNIMKVAKKLGIDAKSTFSGLLEKDVKKIKANLKK